MADLEARVREELERMRPHLERSGARVELVGVEDRIARIRLALGRPGPGRAVVSLQVKSGLERLLKERIADLRGVEALNLPPLSLLGWDREGVAPAAAPERRTAAEPPES